MNNEMTLYISEYRERKSNTSYPLEVVITCAEDLAEAAAWDHVSARYKNGKNSKGDVIRAHRAKRDFISADNTCMDCDNKPDNPTLPDLPPEEWKTPADVQQAFPDVAFYAVPSRNHMKEKDGYPARSKYHYYFPHREPVTDAEKWAAMKQQLLELFPAFDPAAKDAARFMFGVENPQPEFFPGNLCIDEFLSQRAVASAPPKRTAGKATDSIPAGQRNDTLYRYAVTVIKRYGTDDGRAAAAFNEQAAKCEQPLPVDELQTIWSSALKYYNDQVKTAPDYVSPKEYAAQNLIPSDYTDVGQANKLVELSGDKLRYSKATNWLVYNGQVWQENETQAQGLSQELTERQLAFARQWIEQAQAEENDAIESGDEDATKKAGERLLKAKCFRGYALNRRKSSRVAATLTEARPKLQIDVKELDKDPFLLNTPKGTVDLRTGKILPHDPNDYCTKITAVSPGYEGREEFEKFLDRVTCGDKDLAEYHQIIAGMKAVGKVFCENIEIDIGKGGNGKSTLNNSMFLVMGDYAGTISSETLTVNNRHNKSPEYAELRGKRLVIAAELEEGARLDTAILKKLCSTDPIQAEKKFQAPFSYIPSHTLVLYTNHLPKISTTDKATWDRVAIVPFNANFRGVKGEIKNYADYLFKNCGGYILTWIIEGAKKFIDDNYFIEQPECVKAAIAEYRASSDWVANFLAERCEINPAHHLKSSMLYDEYANYCNDTGEYKRRMDDFKAAMESAGYTYRRSAKGMFVYGLRIINTMPISLTG